MDRRHFLKSTLASSSLLALGDWTVPSFLARSARAAGERGSGHRERMLVVIQLLGGNDGLNTVVPHKHDGYLKGRRILRVRSEQALSITPEIGLHPSMTAVSKLVEKGRVAILQGVGYPNPDRSHFRSMEIWESARLEEHAGLGENESFFDDPERRGWLGMATESSRREGLDFPALALGTRGTPNALRSPTVQSPVLNSLDQYAFRLGGDEANRGELRRSMIANAEPQASQGDEVNPLLGFIRRSTLSAYTSSQRLEELASKPQVGPASAQSGLAKRLGQVAQLIAAGFRTPIFYTTLDGFDTHAYQFQSHAGLLTELSDAIGSFQTALAEAKTADDVMILVFSEFGRRVAENASSGTDHGAAAPVFLVGPVAKAGLVGDHPRFDDLDDGDLKYHTDFRRVYATLLERWLNLPAGPIVGEAFTPLDVLSA